MSVAAILSDLQYRGLKDYVLGYTGLWYYSDKDEDFAARLGRRFSARGIQNCGEYIQLLRAHAPNAAEMDHLVGELTIGETYFFRQREHFDLLRDLVIPDLLERNRESRRIRIWSAGCATGAEPYSIEMLLELEMAHRIAGWEIAIVATDINSDFLSRAREARFAEWAFRETPEAVRLRCFERQGNAWVLRPEFRRRVTFHHHNLAGNVPITGIPDWPFDVVLCRNVLIYFAQELVQSTAKRFYEALRVGGWLVLGHAEPSAGTFAPFRRVSAGNVTLYQKPPADAPPAEPVVHDRQVKAIPPARIVRRPRQKAPGRTAALPAARIEATAPAAPGVDEVRQLADRGDWDAAEKLGRKLTESEPLNAAAHFTLGLIFEHISSCHDATASLRRAIYLDRGFALAHYHLGTCLQNIKQPETARKAFRNVIQLLTARPAEETVEHGDGLTVAELKDLARMHIELLGGAA